MRKTSPLGNGKVDLSTLQIDCVVIDFEQSHITELTDEAALGKPHAVGAPSPVATDTDGALVLQDVTRGEFPQPEVHRLSTLQERDGILDEAHASSCATKRGAR